MDGKEVTLAGFAHETRDLGGIAFLVLRDRKGLAQITLVKKLLGKDAFKSARSISRETTFEVDTDRMSVLEETMDSLSRDIHQSLVEEQYLFRTITIKVRDTRFATHTRSRTLDRPTEDLHLIRTVSRELLLEFLDGRKIRLLGLRLSHLYKDHTVQATIQEYL